MIRSATGTLLLGVSTAFALSAMASTTYAACNIVNYNIDQSRRACMIEAKGPTGAERVGATGNTGTSASPGVSGESAPSAIRAFGTGFEGVPSGEMGETGLTSDRRARVGLSASSDTDDGTGKADADVAFGQDSDEGFNANTGFAVDARTGEKGDPSLAISARAEADQASDRDFGVNADLQADVTDAAILQRRNFNLSVDADADVGRSSSTNSGSGLNAGVGVSSNGTGLAGVSARAGRSGLGVGVGISGSGIGVGIGR